MTLDPARLAAYNLTPLQVAGALGLSNRRLPSGQFATGNREYMLETGEFLRTAEDVRNVVVGVVERTGPSSCATWPRSRDGGEEPSQYVRYSRRASGFDAGRDHRHRQAQGHQRRRGGGERAAPRSSRSRARVIPARRASWPSRATTARPRPRNRTSCCSTCCIAVVSVSILIAITLGLRESLIVFIAIPVTLALTLAVFYLYGYTLNRITLFALIFSIGILVDDAIVVVENIVRHWRMPANRERPPYDVAIEAVDEVGNPTILATLTVVAAILPMAFVGGLMGPYMRPIPIGATRGHGLLADRGLHGDALGRGAHAQSRRRQHARRAGGPR